METTNTGIHALYPDHIVAKVGLVKPGGGFEWVWAMHKGDDLFQIDNEPLFVDGVKFRDIVRAEPYKTGGWVIPGFFVYQCIVGHTD